MLEGQPPLPAFVCGVSASENALSGWRGQSSRRKVGVLGVGICAEHGRVECWLKIRRESVGTQLSGTATIVSVLKSGSSRFAYTNWCYLLLKSLSPVLCYRISLSSYKQPSYMSPRQRTSVRCCSRGACSEAVTIWKCRLGRVVLGMRSVRFVSYLIFFFQDFCLWSSWGEGSQKSQ